MRVATLDTLTEGARGEVLAISDASERSRCLRRMGLREGLIVEVASGRDPVMLRFDGCTLAVGRETLREVTICRCGCEKEDARSQAEARRRISAAR